METEPKDRNTMLLEEFVAFCVFSNQRSESPDQKALWRGCEEEERESFRDEARKIIESVKEVGVSFRIATKNTLEDAVLDIVTWPAHPAYTLPI